MRYLGNKTKLLPFIERVIDKYNIEGEIFADLFAGTGAVGDYFKDEYTIISNDFLYYPSVFNRAKLMNNTKPAFAKFEKRYGADIFDWLNRQQFEANDYYFVYQNYSPVGGRMFFTEENALQIDGIRIKIEELLLDGLLEDNEYYFLLGSLLESVTRYSNTSGTFEAYFKFWDSRALKGFQITPLEMNNSLSVSDKNEVYQEDTNALVKKITGDIAYIDTPYTVTQYVSAYHMLETIAKYDFPEIKGVGGKRGRESKNSLYARKNEARIQFEDLFRQLQFKHVLISYSNQGLVPMEELIELARLFAVDGNVFVEERDYQEYQNHRSSNKNKGRKLKEVIIYFEKNLQVKKSPLNYSGSKDTLVPTINKELPKHVGTFVDVMGGAFNVGVNIVATEKVIYNEINPHIYGIVSWLLENEKAIEVDLVKAIIKNYGLTKAGKEAYLKLREDYNAIPTVEKLFVLHMYSFQNMIRFNNNQKFNTPIGVAGISDDLINRMNEFVPRTSKIELINKDYAQIDFSQFPKDSVFYFDPPYYITSAAYNDGKRGMKGWNSEAETELLDILTKMDKNGYKFILSNVIKHKGKTNHILKEWIQEHDFIVHEAGVSGWRYAKDEVIIKNYEE